MRKHSPACSLVVPARAVVILIASLLVMYSFIAPAVRADWFAPYIEYRHSPELGFVKIAEGIVRGKKYVEQLENPANIARLAKHNIFSTQDKVLDNYTRIARFGEHLVLTKISISPPTGHGYGGANPSTHLTIVINGRKKVDCSFGYAPWRENLDVHAVTVYPEDGVLSVDASCRGEIKMPFSAVFIEDPRTITDDLLLTGKN